MDRRASILRVGLRACFWVSLSAWGCGPCQCGSAASRDLQVEGPPPYIRCIDLAVADQRFEGGELRDRTLRFPAGERVAVFTGPAPFPMAEVAIATLADADWIVVLGGLGDTVEAARKTLQTLARIGVPVVVMAGGSDEAPSVLQAFHQLTAPQVIDARGVRVIEVGAELRVGLLSGAPAGRYARSGAACGFAAADVERLADEIGTAKVLVSWAAPTGSSLSRGFGGLDAGSDEVERLRERIGATFGVYAWPSEHPGRASANEVIVKAISGDTQDRADGSRVSPGPTWIRFEAAGYRVISGAEAAP